MEWVRGEIQREQHGHGRQNTQGMFQVHKKEQLNLNNNLYEMKLKKLESFLLSSKKL